MFEDIIGKSTKKKDKLESFENTDCCPYCGSEKIGMTLVDSSSRGIAMFCSICGCSWLVA
jgi:transcription elongation factor Elf1